MTTNRFFSLAAGLAIATMVGCGGGDEEFETTDTEIITEPGVEEVEVLVPTTDSLMVERTVETEVEVDTTDID